MDRGRARYAMLKYEDIAHFFIHSLIIVVYNYNCEILCTVNASMHFLIVSN